MGSKVPGDLLYGIEREKAVGPFTYGHRKESETFECGSKTDVDYDFRTVERTLITNDTVCGRGER